mmetsp:Transcript_16597/g.55197  ORF Transcript_16597/g.55197 Transcript_16597/m.55197 type:complete len:211 (-) Transcript_16597:485-1117(-)
MSRASTVSTSRSTPLAKPPSGASSSLSASTRRRNRTDQTAMRTVDVPVGATARCPTTSTCFVYATWSATAASIPATSRPTTYTPSPTLQKPPSTSTWIRDTGGERLWSASRWGRPAQSTLSQTHRRSRLQAPPPPRRPTPARLAGPTPSACGSSTMTNRDRLPSSWSCPAAPCTSWAARRARCGSTASGNKSLAPCHRPRRGIPTTCGAR